MKKLIFNLCIISPLFLSACSNNSSQHLERVRTKNGEKLTVGKVQRTIRMGMTNAEVAETLGSPNVLSTDEERREVWVYDKISTELVYSTSSSGGGISALVLGLGAGIAGGGGVGMHGDKSTGAHSTSQRTLTIIVKFTKQGRVRDIAYHASQF